MISDALRLRPATLADERLLLDWVNDPAVRRSAFRQDLVAGDEHARWLRERLRDPASVLLIAEEGVGGPIGQVRFDLSGTEAEIDVSIAPAHRGRHLAQPIIRAAVQELSTTRGIGAVHAHVRPENVASLRAFRAAGFVDAGPGAVAGVPCVHLVWSSR